MLSVNNLSCSYGRISAVLNASLEVKEGEIVSLIGANGAGKTTLLRAISGLHKPDGGSVEFQGKTLHSVPASARVKAGLVQVPEGRRVFGPMAIEDNLELGGVTVPKAMRQRAMEEVFDMFPILAERRKLQAGSLSGGEQQMLAIGRALMASPKLLLMDEPSLGLAPKIIVEIFQLVQKLNRQGTSVLLVEQNAVASLQISHRAYVMESGQITREGSALALQNDPKVQAAFLGGAVAA